MPSCAARSAVVADMRADKRPIFRPTRCAQTMTMPSRMWNCLLSLPSPCSTTRPSVRTPSTSNNTSRMRAALASIDKGTAEYSEHTCPPEIVHVHDPGDLQVTLLDHDDRSDLPLLHDVQRFDCERRPRYRHR